MFAETYNGNILFWRLGCLCARRQGLVNLDNNNDTIDSQFLLVIFYFKKDLMSCEERRGEQERLTDLDGGIKMTP